MEKKRDRRVNRTRKLMHEALMGLIVEKGYEAVTVQDILDRADVGRSTFYSHYRDKDELLFSGVEHLRSLFEQQQQSLRAAQHGKEGPGFNMILELFRHVAEHSKLYKAFAGRQSGEMILKYVFRYLYDMLIVPHKALVKSKKKTPVPIEVTTHWIVTSLLSLIVWWLNNNMPYTPEQMEEMFRLLATPGIETALGQRVNRKDLEKQAKSLKGGTAKEFYRLFADDESSRGK